VMRVVSGAQCVTLACCVDLIRALAAVSNHGPDAMISITRTSLARLLVSEGVFLADPSLAVRFESTLIGMPLWLQLGGRRSAV
jgi:hypothetical protein